MLYTVVLNNLRFFKTTFQALPFVKKENSINSICREKPEFCYVVQNSSGSIMLQLLKVMQSKAHKRLSLYQLICALGRI